MERFVDLSLIAMPQHQPRPEASRTGTEHLAPSLPALDNTVERALGGTEFRGLRSPERLRQLFRNGTFALPDLSAEAAVFARPPEDLPALLRLADQLEALASVEQGEAALGFRCSGCGMRYAVPSALARAVVIPCERCAAPVDLSPSSAQGDERLVDPFTGALNASRRAIALFFREAMARNWTVVVYRRPK